MRRSTPLLPAACIALSLLLGTSVRAYVCDIPTNGCTHGMFNVDECKCDCIHPYCPDDNGDCNIASGNCPNPWDECERGVNCPWWKNPLKAESCTTGPKVPAGFWVVYNVEEICCQNNFPYSQTCMSTPATSTPTKYPTISKPLDDDFEVIPLKFDVTGLPEGIKMRELKQEMLTVLKRILLRLADRIPGLKISSVDEKVVVQNSRNGGRNLLKRALRALEEEGDRGSDDDPDEFVDRRSLAEDVSLYYNVFVVRDENKKFGPLIIQELRDSWTEVMEQIQTFTDTKFFGSDLKLNWCAFQNGKYDLCVVDLNPPPPARAPTPVVIVKDDEGDDDGLAGWAIALIIIVCLLIVCCIGYWIAVCCFGVANCFASCCGGDDYHEEKEVHNNIYMDDGRRDDERFMITNGDERSRRDEEHLRIGYGDDERRRDEEHLRIGNGDERSRRGRAITNGDERSRATGYTSRRSGHSRQIVLAPGQDQTLSTQDDFTINTRGTKKSRRTARDPTMYVPGQEDKPDPDSDGRSIRSGSRYGEDPPLKAKRDPTMYYDGSNDGGDPPLKPQRDPTMYVEGQQDPTMYVEGQQDPSMYVEDQQDPSFYEDAHRTHMHASIASDNYSVEEMYNDDNNHHMGGIDEEGEYDQYSYGNGSYGEGRGGSSRAREPSYHTEDKSSSFRTQEPSVTSSRKSSKKGKKSSKKKKGLRNSLNDDWEGSYPDVSERTDGDDGKRQTQSFYN